MGELTLLDRFRKRINLNRLDRLTQHYAGIKGELTPKTAKEKEEVEFFSTEFERYARQTSRLSNIRIFFSVLLYAALFINVLKLIPILSFLVAFIQLGSALFSTSLVFLIVFLLSIRIRLNIDLMQDCMLHLVTFYYRNPKRNTKEALAKISRAI